MTRLADVVVYWNGTAVNQTVGNVTRAMQGYLVVEPATIEPVVDKQFQSVELQTGDPIVGGASGYFTVRGVTSTTSSLAAVERELLDDWSLMGSRYNPFDGVVDLRVDRVDAAAAAVSRVLRVRASQLATVTGHRGDLKPGLRLSDAFSGATTAKPHYYYPVAFTASYGLWKQRTAATGTGTATTGGATVSTVNSGVRGVEGRIEFGTVTGSPTTLTIALSGTTYLTFTSPATGQYYDFGYTTPGDYTGTATLVAGSTNWRIPAGTTNWTATVTAGTGTVPITASFKPEFNSW